MVHDSQSSQSNAVGEASCKQTRTCLEAIGKFTGGSLPWKGTTQQQAAAARASEIEALNAEPPCVWGRCPSVACPTFSCSGTYDKDRYRPLCKSFKEHEKRDWCYEKEGTVLSFRGNCWRSPYSCTPPDPPPVACPKKPLGSREIPLFIWSEGYCYPNYGAAPFPFKSKNLIPPKVEPIAEVKLPETCNKPGGDPDYFDRCNIYLGGPNKRTRERRLEDAMLFSGRSVDKCSQSFRESEWCEPVPNGGVVRSPPLCKPCVCPLL